MVVYRDEVDGGVAKAQEAAALNPRIKRIRMHSPLLVFQVSVFENFNGKPFALGSIVSVNEVQGIGRRRQG